MKLIPDSKQPTASRGALLGAAAAVAAAASAVWVAARARRAEREHVPLGRFIEVDGVRLHVVDRGTGAPVLLIHGNAVSLDDFAASGLIDQLALTHRVIAVDRPGCGHSSRPRDRLWTPAAQAALLRAALLHLGIDEPAVVVGHSIGTMVAVALAQDFPTAVRGLVLLGGYYYPNLRLDALLTAPVALPVVGDALRYTLTALAARAALNRLIEAMFSPREVPAGYVDALSREMMLRPLQLRANAEEGAYMVPAARHSSGRHAELRLPVMLLAGGDDLIVDVAAQSQRLHRELPQSQLTVLPGVGHMLHHAAPEAVVSAVRDAAEPVPDDDDGKTVSTVDAAA